MGWVDGWFCICDFFVSVASLRNVVIHFPSLLVRYDSETCIDTDELLLDSVRVEN